MYKITKSDIERILENDVQNLIKEYSGKNADDLIYYLRGKKLPTAFIADQIICRKKALKKFPTLSKNNLLYEAIALEQSSSEATAIYKAGLMQGKSFIDLTGGLGIDSITMSNKFNRVIYSEMNSNLAELFRYNSALINKNIIEINSGDSIEFLKSWRGEKFDWIYLDPARREAGRRSVDLEYCTPNVYENLELLKEKSKNICLKVSPAFDFSEAERKLPGLTDYIVVSVNNECKEVLLLLKGKPEVFVKRKHAVALDEFGNIKFELSIPSDKSFERNVREKLGKYFYEPDTSIIKSGLTNYVGKISELFFLNNIADYLTSNTRKQNFPGRIFEVTDVWEYKPGFLKKHFRESGIVKANISKREFPKSVDEIRKELKLSDGGENYLFFTKDKSNRLLCIISKKI